MILGNWKMNHGLAETREFMSSLNSLPRPESPYTFGVAVPYTSLAVALECRPAGMLIGAQNVHWESAGAHTGEIAPQMLNELGVEFVVVGHSERRQFYGETDEAVSKRAKAAIAASLLAVVCVGETEEEYQAGKTEEVVRSQLQRSLRGVPAANLVIAYEPVWAIGTGLAATPEIADSVHQTVKAVLEQLYLEAAQAIPILYGGSMKPDNAGELLQKPRIDGGLIGGASLKADSFCRLIDVGLRGFAASSAE